MIILWTSLSHWFQHIPRVSNTVIYVFDANIISMQILTVAAFKAGVNNEPACKLIIFFSLPIQSLCCPFVIVLPWVHTDRLRCRRRHGSKTQGPETWLIADFGNCCFPLSNHPAVFALFLILLPRVSNQWGWNEENWAWFHQKVMIVHLRYHGW